MKAPHPEDSAVAAQSSSPQQSSYSQQPQAPPQTRIPEIVTEEIQHLKESNESLKKTNENMGEEIAELKQKMTDFESAVRSHVILN